MWNDNPSEVDLLGFHRFVHAIEQLAVMEQLQPLTIGVYGTWGGGKSSVMRIAFQNLEKTDGVVPIWISSWTLEDFNHTKSALILSILKALKDKQTYFSAFKDQLDKLRKRVDWMRAGLLLAQSGIAIGTAYATAQTGQPQPQSVSVPTLDDLTKVFKTQSEDDSDVTSIAGFQEEFAKLLKDATIKSLVIFIDDLDRCMPRTIIQNFEAIRLFLAVPKTVFVIGASEEIIESAISTQYPAQERGVSYGKQYLEKIIQVPIHLPPLNPQETLRYLLLLFASRQIRGDNYTLLVTKLREEDQNGKYAHLLTPSDILEKLEQGFRTPQLKQNMEIGSRIALSLHEGTRGNPREVKRFLNTLILRQTIGTAVGLELDLAIMAKLMLLETYHNSFFKTLFEWHLFYGKTIPHLEYLEEKINSTASSEPEHEDEATTAKDSKNLHPPEYDQAVISACKELLEDKELCTCIGLLPSLVDAELTSYFYLARESLDTRNISTRPLSRQAQEVLNSYMVGGELNIQRANDALKSLDRADVNDILTQLLRRYQTQPSDEKWRKALAGVGTTRVDCVPQLIQELKRMPITPSAADIMALGTISQAHPQHSAVILAWFDELAKRDTKLTSAVRMVKNSVQSRK